MLDVSLIRAERFEAAPRRHVLTLWLVAAIDSDLSVTDSPPLL